MTEEGASPGPGSVLRSTRESLGYTQQDVADSLNLTLRAVDDLECERWDRFHAVAFARGYVKSYAKLLGLDPQTVVADYGEFTEPESEAPPVALLREASAGGVGRLGEMFQRQPGAVLSGTVVIAIAAIAIALVMVWPESDQATEPSLSQRSALTPPPGPAVAAPALSAPEVGATSGRSSPLSGAAETEAIMPSTTVAESDVVAASPPAATEVVVPDAEQHPAPAVAPARRITPIGDDRLELSFSSDCWVEIKDGAGQSLYSNLSRSGDTLHLVGGGPFRILLGYGPGVSLTFNGEPVPLARYTRNNVASVVLGTD